MSRRKSFDCWWRRPYAIQSAPSLMCLILLRVCCFIATRKLMPVISCAAWEIHCMRLPRKSSAFSIGLVAPSQYVYSNLIQVHGCSRLNMHTKYHRKIYTCTWKIRSKRWDAWMVSANKLNIWVNNNEKILKSKLICTSVWMFLCPSKAACASLWLVRPHRPWIPSE
jgi:hypothetical protein